MAATFTKQSATFKQGSKASLRQAAAAIVGHETKEVAAGQAFLAWCDASLSELSISTVVSALYYLPQNFMIMLPRAVAKISNLADMLSGSTVKNQIHFYDKQDSSEKDGSFSFIDADFVIAEGVDASVAIIPANKYSELAAKDFSFAVGRSPEAIASTLLKLSRDDA